jgi:hypothetical protein
MPWAAASPACIALALILGVLTHPAGGQNSAADARKPPLKLIASYNYGQAMDRGSRSKATR